MFTPILIPRTASSTLLHCSRPPPRLGRPRDFLQSLYHASQKVSRRSFIASSSNASAPTSIQASRTLPHPTLQVYRMIADIASYPSFVPYCRSTHVTSFSQPDVHFNERWPHTATLTVGFQDQISETFSSRVFCAPPYPHRGRAGIGFVEALSGSESGQPEFGPGEQDDLSHHFSDVEENASREEAVVRNADSPLAFLKARWSVRSYPHKPGPGGGQKTQEVNLEPHSQSREMTEVRLAIEFRFRNPVYEMLGKTMTSKVADKMVEAFEQRAQKVLGGN